MLLRVGELEQRLREANAALAAGRTAAADSRSPNRKGRLSEHASSSSLLEKLAAANEELQIQAEESQVQAEELATQAEELEVQRDELQFMNQELDGERALLRTVLEQIPAGLIVAAPSGKLLLVNPQMEAILGRPLSQDDSLERSSLFLGRHADGSPLARRDYPLACCFTRGETVSEKEFPLLRSDGSQGVVQVSAAPVRNRQGEIVAGVATYSDVTGRKQRDREIERLASFPELNPNPILEVDTSDRITYSNQAAREVLAGLGPPAKLTDLLPTDLKQILLTIKRTGQTSFQREVQVKDTVYLQSLSYIEPFRAIRLYGIDISKRKRSESSALQAYREWERTFEAVPDLVAIVDTGHRLVRVNRAMAAALGADPQELAGKPCYQLMHRSSCPSDVCPHSLLLQDGQEHSAELREFGRDFLVTATPLLDNQGEIMGSVHVARDITERKQAEEALSRLNEELEQRVQERTEELGQAVAQLREEVIQRQEAEEEVRKLNQELEERVQERTVQLLAANKEMEAFAYSVSHDLKAPIRAIDGFSRILMLEHAGQLDSEGLRLLEVVRRNTAFMAHLIDDLLALSRLGRQEVRKSRIDLAPEVTKLVKELRAAEPGHALDLKITELPPAFGDLSLLRQVLANLLANAFKFTQHTDKAVIEVGGERLAGETIYYVKDNGIGFDMRYRDKLFGVFQRLHPIGEFEGTGVGLAIVHRILQRHEGRVWAEGKVNEGATFFFALPAGTENP